MNERRRRCVFDGQYRAIEMSRNLSQAKGDVIYCVFFAFVSYCYFFKVIIQNHSLHFLAALDIAPFTFISDAKLSPNSIRTSLPTPLIKTAKDFKEGHILGPMPLETFFAQTTRT